jgi:hypothetical protein
MTPDGSPASRAGSRHLPLTVLLPSGLLAIYF